MTAQQLTTIEAANEETAVVTIENITVENIRDDYAPIVFGHNCLNHFVELVRKNVIGEVPDLTTDKGRKRVASLAATVARSKTAVDEVGRNYLRKLKAMTKPIEAELREFETAMNALRDEVRKPLDEWQAKVDAEAAVLQAAVDQVIARFTLPADADAETIQAALFALEQEPLTVEVFGKRLEEVEGKRTYGITLLNDQLAKRQQYDREQAELIENRQRIAKLEEQQRITAAAAQAVEDERLRVAGLQQQQRDDDARRLREAEDTAQKAVQERQAIIDQQANKERLEREAQEQQQREEAARIADKAHQGRINRAALDALMSINLASEGQPAAFLKPSMAKEIMSAIIRGQIPAVTIAY